MILGLLLLGYAAAITFHIQYREPYCFTYKVEKNSQISVFYHITGNNPHKVSVQILDYQKRVVAAPQPPQQMEGELEEDQLGYYSKLGGQYSLCFERSDNQKKSVFFVWTSDRQEQETSTNADSESIYALEKKFEQVAKVMDHISEHIKVQEMDEEQQHQLTKANNSKVLWWSLFKILLIVLSCLLEVFLVTSYFAGGNSLGRKLVKIGMRADQTSNGTTPAGV